MPTLCDRVPVVENLPTRIGSGPGVVAGIGENDLLAPGSGGKMTDLSNPDAIEA